MSLEKQVRSLRRLRLATITATLCGHAASALVLWFTAEDRAVAQGVGVLGAIASALLLPHFLLRVGRVADAVRGDGRRSLDTGHIWGAFLTPVWSMVGIPTALARTGVVVAAATNSPSTQRYLRALAWAYGLALFVGPAVAILLLGTIEGIVSAGGLSTFLLALASHLLVQPLENALDDRVVRAFGGVGKDEPIAIPTL
jgi:hypothetical protein